MKESVFGRLPIYCGVVLLKLLRACDEPFLLKMKIFKSDKLIKSF